MAARAPAAQQAQPRRWKAFTITALAVGWLWCGAATADAQTRPAPAPPPASEPAAPRAVQASRQMVAAANPLAAEAGLEILRKGGSAIDATIAVQLVLGLVEPQSSGIGGGAFLVHYDAAKGETVTYDGREKAPQGASATMFLDLDGKPLPFAEASVGGIAVGTPGLLRMLELAHRDHGRLPWGRLFEPAMRLAEDGFPVSVRLNRQIAADEQLKSFAAARAYFYDADGNARAAGTRLANPAYAETLRMIANGGADAFYSGAIAQDIENAVRSTGTRPGTLGADDLAAYRAVKREAVCGPYRGTRLCGMGPPSSGGITVLQILGMLSAFDPKLLAPTTLKSVYLTSEASRLAFADRNQYIGDGDFVSVPIAEMLDPTYLTKRAKLISMTKSLGRAEPGRPGTRAGALSPVLVDTTPELPSTSHISVIDATGNAVAMTTSIENVFGSKILVRGFLLNNEMTDFAFRPIVDEQPVANRIEPFKRPRSSMSPMLGFDKDGKLLLSLGSPGGPRIIGYVVKTLSGVIDGGLDIQAAISLPNFINMNGATELEDGTPLTRLGPELQALGQTVQAKSLDSGLQGIMVVRRGDEVRLFGGADPRREGVAVGD